jgi:hypothetical protein
MPDSALCIQGEQGAKFRRGLFDGTLRQEQTGEAELQLGIIRVGTSVPAKTLDLVWSGKATPDEAMTKLHDGWQKMLEDED